MITTLATALSPNLPLGYREDSNWPGRKTVVSPTGEAHAHNPVRTRADPALLKALARAFRWQRLLDEGRYGSISELAAAERIERGYLGRVLQLTLMPPKMVEAIVNGRQGADVTLPGLMGGVQVGWGERR